MKKLKIFKNAYAYLRIWLANGQSFFNDLKYPILLAVALKIYFPSASFLTMALIVIAIVIILVSIGWFDLKFIKIAQRVAEIQTAEYNPYFKRLDRKI